MMAAKKLIFEVAGSCDCRNLCNRSSKRGACPCLSQEVYCSDECKCGTAKQQCSNRYGSGGALDILFGIDQGKGTKGSADDSSEDTMVSKKPDL